jgi:hypothetical protein
MLATALRRDGGLPGGFPGGLFRDVRDDGEPAVELVDYVPHLCWVVLPDAVGEGAGGGALGPEHAPTTFTPLPLELELIRKVLSPSRTEEEFNRILPLYLEELLRMSSSFPPVEEESSDSPPSGEGEGAGGGAIGPQHAPPPLGLRIQAVSQEQDPPANQVFDHDPVQPDPPGVDNSLLSDDHPLEPKNQLEVDTKNKNSHHLGSPPVEGWLWGFLYFLFFLVLLR